MKNTMYTALFFLYFSILNNNEKVFPQILKTHIISFVCYDWIYFWDHILMKSSLFCL